MKYYPFRLHNHAIYKQEIGVIPEMLKPQKITWCGIEAFKTHQQIYKYYSEDDYIWLPDITYTNELIIKCLDDKNVQFDIPTLCAHRIEMPLRLMFDAIINNPHTEFKYGKCLSIPKWCFYKMGCSILIAEAE